MRQDEENFQFSLSLNQLFRQLESKLYPFLCIMKMTIVNRSAQVPYVSRDVMGNSLRHINTEAERHRRDYRILRDIVLLFSSIQADYETDLSRQSRSVDKRHPK